MHFRQRPARAHFLAGAAFLALTLGAASAHAADASNITIAPQPLDTALNELGSLGNQQILIRSDIAAGKTAHAVSGAPNFEAALVAMLDGTGLTWRRQGTTYLILDASDPQSGSAAGDGADAGTVAALIVTAQKREEQIQDVPIAISAFTEKSLQEQKIEGGFDLLKAIPNVTFSKSNFTSYNFSIRGIGTKAISATTDPGVAVSFNNVALIQNRLFEQEYFDVERVEVLRGPQGTLYGRNATAGVINVISAKPNLRDFDGWVKGEVGNYHAKRISAMINVPLIEDKLAVRIAGSLTDRQGYDYNTGTHHPVNGRDLWSGRITVQFNPTERIRTNLVWERFNEDDNRSRTGKQLCHRDPGPTMIGNTPTQWTSDYGTLGDTLVPALFSQGCKPGSLYDQAAFGTPNGLAMPFVFGMIFVGTGCEQGDGICSGLFPIGVLGDPQVGRKVSLIDVADPYGGRMQSPDLRVINSFRDPIYRAKADVVQFNFDVDVGSGLTLYGQTVYNKDQTYSFQDYNRFNTVPIFRDTSQLWNPYPAPESGPTFGAHGPYADLAPGGILCDPQLGCSNSIAGFDIAQAKGQQFTQELRLQSSLDGPLNFSLGANYTHFKTLVDYYVMYNLITAFATMPPFNDDNDLSKCTRYTGTAFGFDIRDINDPAANCPYVDPNPVESINGEGHNYFRSKNPYKLQSAAAFGEIYWKFNEDLKLTAGLRYTDDRKTFIPVPTQILLSTAFVLGGYVNKGYPEDPALKQHWGEFTGRLGVDWKPDLTFTDQSLLYAFYSRGYKGGGMNPPGIGYDRRTLAERFGIPPGVYPPYDHPVLEPKGVNYPDTFKPEFVNAFEVGSKNTLLSGAMTLNGDAFFYDYKDYQVSKIVDRTAVNENFDARVWGLEGEMTFHPSRNFGLIANIGYLDSSIGKGAKSIDIMNRTQSNPAWTVVKPWVELPSNCIVPTSLVEQYLTINHGAPNYYWELCGGWTGVVGDLAPVRDPNTGQRWDPMARDADGNLLYPEINGGAGIAQNLEGNELPNSPHWTANIGAQYSAEFAGGWKATVRADGYWQSQSWARVYNAVNDKLHGWYNANLSFWVERPEDGLKIELYAKNILDKTPITDAFINSDDTALTTNVFVLDPRLIGLSIRKDF